MQDKNEIFALDIGTRTIVGMVVKKEGNNFNILAQETMEHGSRVMYDGQIHDIETVSENVIKVKKSLEKQLGYKLEKAAVAAAGRAIYTVKAEAQKEASPYLEITYDDIKSLEADAISNAVRSLSTNKESASFKDYHCVGYSVINWFLENDPIDNLLGQKGKNISVEIVAIFLPRVVVESLLTVLKRCGMQLYSITLEPIAASDVVVLPNMRKLNIALVDIGAGTSDIAISKNGSIIAYGMVPIAGDELTEKICETFLLDFDEGEKVKREISQNDIVTFQNILGQTQKLSASEILDATQNTLQKLAASIARKILELNKEPPAAVICIGGGSLMPGITEYIAYNLELPKQRVAIKGKESISFINGGDELSGPFCITPIGIAVNALYGTYLSFIQVYVNEKPMNILAQNQPTVLDALLYTGYTSSQIFGRPGMAKTFTLNGKINIIKGTMAKPGKVFVDGQDADFSTKLWNNALIDFIPAENGRSGRAKIKDFITEDLLINITINGRDFCIEPIIKANGKKVDLNYEIEDDAKITISKRDMIFSDIFNIISFEINDVKGNLVMEINGQKAGFASKIKDGDDISIYWKNTM